MSSPPIRSNPIDETLSATDRNRDNSVRRTNVIVRTARQAADRANREATEAQRVAERQRLPRPVSRRDRNELRSPNYNLFENSPKYTLESYQRTRSDEIYISLEYFDNKIENLAHNIMATDISEQAIQIAKYNNKKSIFICKINKWALFFP